jgi:phosphate starvation-inducible protein PhoH
VIQKRRGRPGAKLPTEQIAVRLPKAMVDEFRKSPRGLSGEIQERLFSSLFASDPRFVTLSGQIEELAKDVRRAIGADWHSDKKAHQVFLETIKRLLADLPEPTAELSAVKADASTAAEMIYNRYAETVREAMTKSETVMKPAIRQQLEKDNG